MFVDGVLKDKIVGFDEFGGKDDFETIVLSRRYLIFPIHYLFIRLVKAGMIKPKNK